MNLKGLQTIYHVQSSSCYHPNSDLCEISHIPIMPRYENMIWRMRRNHSVHSTKPTVCYKLKTCIVQTINSAYKGISVFYTDKVSVYTVDMKHRQLNQWDSDTARACDYWYWSGTGQLGHMHNSPLWHQKGRHSKESVYKKTKTKSLCLSMANTWPRFFLLLWQGEVRVKVMFLWAEVELAACVPVHF